MKDDNNWVEEIGKPTYESIKEMVDALDFDKVKAEYVEALGHKQAVAKLIEIRGLDPEDDQPEIGFLYSLSPTRIKERLLEELTDDDFNDLDDDGYETARQAIAEDPLEVSVRTGWYAPGTENPEAEEFMILLGTGGPATRIVGDLGQHGEPESARLECQDWGHPWTEYFGTDEDVLLEYARNFFFGE